MRSRKPRGPVEPKFWNRQPFDLSGIPTATPVSMAFFTPGAFNVTAQDTRITALRNKISLLLTFNAVGIIGFTPPSFRIMWAVEKAQTGSPVANPNLPLTQDAVADYMAIGSGFVSCFGALVDTAPFWSTRDSGGGQTLELDVMSKRKLDANDELRFNIFVTLISGVSGPVTYDARFRSSTLYQRTLR